MKAATRQHPARLRWFSILAGCCFGFVYLGSALVAGAAEPAPPAAQKTAAKPSAAAPVPLPASEIIPRAEQTLRSLQAIRAQISADTAASLNSIQSELTAFAEKSDRRWEEAKTISTLRSLQNLNDLQRQWTVEQSQLDGWAYALTRQSQALIEQEEGVGATIITWQATATAGKQQALPSIAFDKIAEVVREAESVRELIRHYMARVLNLQNQLATRREILTKIRADLDRARQESNRRLFVLDTPPLWQAVFHPQAEETIITELAESARTFSADVSDFVEKYADRTALHAIIFLLLAIWLYFVRRGLEPDVVMGFAGSAKLLFLERFLSSSFLLSLLAVPLLYPEAASGILRIAIVPTVIPIVRLCPGLFPDRFRRPIYMLATLYVLDFLRYILPHDWLLTRLLLLLMAISGLLALALLLRSLRAEPLGPGLRARLTVPLARLGLLLFAGSAVTNVIGSLALAEIVLSVPVRITYAAALIATDAHLVMTLIAVLLQSRALRRLRSVRMHRDLIAFRCHVFVHFAAVVFWAVVSMKMLGVVADVSATLADLFQLRWQLGATEISVQDVTIFIAVFVGAFILSRLLQFLLAEEILPRIRLPRGVPGAIDVLTRYGVLLLGFFVALAAAGVDLSKITLLISALGVGIGFGLQNVVNNFVSGLILVFEHPVQVGDSVEVAGVSGEVRKIGFRASVLRTADGAEVVIPNGELAGGKLTNWSLSDRMRRISIPVGVAYGTDPAHVIGILVEIARKHPAVLTTPEPLVVCDRLGDSALNCTLYCWSTIDEFFIARSDLTTSINNAFRQAEVTIPYPQQDVHLHWPDASSSRTAAQARPDELRQKAEPDPARIGFAGGSGKK